MKKNSSFIRRNDSFPNEMTLQFIDTFNIFCFNFLTLKSELNAFFIFLFLNNLGIGGVNTLDVNIHGGYQ